MRARPFAEIDSHCQPTDRRTGSLTEGVVHVSTTSFPIGSSLPAAAVSVGTHVHSRPPTSVTVRLAIIASIGGAWTSAEARYLLGRSRLIGRVVRRRRVHRLGSACLSALVLRLLALSTQLLCFLR